MTNFKIKLAATRAIKLIQRAFAKLGPTHEARLAAMAANPRAIPILNQIQAATSGTRQALTTPKRMFPRLGGGTTKTTDISRRKITPLPYGNIGGQSSTAYIASHPEGGLAVAKRLIPRHDSRTGALLLNPKQALSRELQGGSIMTQGSKQDAILNPFLPRPKTVKTFGTGGGGGQLGRELPTRHTGVGLQDVGKGGYAKLNLDDALVKNRLLGSKKTYTSRTTGKPLRRKPDADFADDLMAAQEDLGRNIAGRPKMEQVSGLKPQADKMPPTVFSEYVNFSPGGLSKNPRAARELAEYLARLRTQQNIAWGDPYMANVRHQTLGGKQAPTALFDFGVARKATHPSMGSHKELVKANLETMMKEVPTPRPLDFPTTQSREKFIADVMGLQWPPPIT